MKVNFHHWRLRTADDPKDPYQFRRCHPCRDGAHEDCDHHLNDTAFDLSEFVPVNCTCQCNDVGLDLMDKHAGVVVERVWSKDLDSTRVTLSLNIPNMYLLEAIEGLSRVDRGYTPRVTIEDLAQRIGWNWEQSVRTYLTDLIDKARLGKAERDEC